MIARQKIVIDKENWMMGMSSSPLLDDGGFSPDSNYFNLHSSPGVFSRLTSPLSLSTVDGVIYATTPALNGNSRYLITSTNKLQSMNSSYAISNSQTVSGTLSSYFTDIVQYGTSNVDNPIFITTDTNIIMSTPSAGVPGSPDNTWWTGTKGKSALRSGYRHCMIVYENSLWIADGSYIHKWDGTTASSIALSLPFNQVIYSFGIEPSTGRMLIGVSERQDATGTLNAIHKVLTWDGYSNKVLKSVIVDGQVTSMTTLEGVVYMAFGTKFGYWNGSGIISLRKLNIPQDSDYLIRSQRIFSAWGRIYFCEGKNVVCYGEIVRGRGKQFYNFLGNNFSNYDLTNGYIDALFPLSATSAGDKENFAVNYNVGGVNTVHAWDTLNVGSGSTLYYNFISNLYSFDKPIIVREVLFEFDTNVSGSSIGTFYLFDNMDNTLNTDATNLVATKANSFVRVPTNNSKATFDVRVKFFPSASLNGKLGIRRIVVYYDDAPDINTS